MFGVLSLAFGLLGVIALVSRGLRPQPASLLEGSGNVPQTASRSSKPRVMAHAVPSRLNLVPAAPLVGADDSTATAPAPETLGYEAYVQQRIAQLNALATHDDPLAHGAILSDVTNPDKEIRHAALEAMIQAQDQSAIPRLREIAATTGDADEKAAILDAVKFMSLPSLTDSLAVQDQNPAVSSDQPPAFRRFHALLDAHMRHTQRDNSSPPPAGQ